MNPFKKHRDSVEVTGADLATPLIDPESSLPNFTALELILRREIARSRRHGDRSSLALFEVQVVAPGPGALPPPSPAAFVAKVLTDCARESDFVARVHDRHFVVFLAQCDQDGSQIFTDRVRTALCTRPYARGAGGSGLYLRAWAGAVQWDFTMEDPNGYLEAALHDLERARAGQNSTSAWFAGAPTP
jgi:GGDEF domain-containing protein